MTVYDIDAPGGVVRFAKIFVRRRLKGFNKDINVRLKAEGADEKEERAFMPGLIAVISLLDLFSGLYAGDVENHNYTHLARYLKAFAPGRYDDYLLKVLYVAFRHKLAHLSHPYFVLNTAKDGRLDKRPMLLTWTITSDRRDEPIKLTPLRRSRLIRRQPTPWRLRIDHVIEISIRTLVDDAIETTSRYLAALKNDVTIQAKFRECMRNFYQT